MGVVSLKHLEIHHSQAGEQLHAIAVIKRAIDLPARFELVYYLQLKRVSSYKSYPYIDVLASRIGMEGLSILRRNQDGQR